MSPASHLADEYWEYYRATAQLWNIDRGDVGEITEWEDLSAAGVDRRIVALNEFAQRANGSFPDESSYGEGDVDAALRAAVAFSARSTAVLLPWMRNRGLVSGPFNFATLLSVLVPGYGLVTKDHGTGYIVKLDGVPAFVDGWIDGLRDGLRNGQTAAARGVGAAIDAYDKLLATGAVDHPLVGQDPPRDLNANEVDRWRAEVIASVDRSVQPALARLRDVLRDEVLPVASSDDRPGLCHLPGGSEAYTELLWAATSTTLGAAEIHQIGLDVLAGLDDEYCAIGGPALQLDDPSAMRARLRDDTSLRYTTTSEIIDDVHAMLDRARSESPRWIGRLPLAACAVVPVDAGAIAYYTGPSPDGQRPGTYYFLAVPHMWTRFTLAPTTFHEAIPGHHLQLALAQELGLHAVVGELEVTAYNEGLGLYAERLADEMGLYTSPLQRLGMLTLDSLRASRLVVDTGLHAEGWSRQRAIDFLADHTALQRSNVEAEIDRYIADPGQATSYMIGRIEIDRLRAEATRRLGPLFTVHGFHDTVLGGGMTPLSELARRVGAWEGGTA